MAKISKWNNFYSSEYFFLKLCIQRVLQNLLKNCVCYTSLSENGPYMKSNLNSMNLGIFEGFNTEIFRSSRHFLSIFFVSQQIKQDYRNFSPWARAVNIPLNMINNGVCLHCFYLNFVCLISFTLILSALIVSTLIVSILIVSNLVVSALIMSDLTFQQFKYLKKAH